MESNKIINYKLNFHPVRLPNNIRNLLAYVTDLET